MSTCFWTNLKNATQVCSEAAAPGSVWVDGIWTYFEFDIYGYDTDYNESGIIQTITSSQDYNSEAFRLYLNDWVRIKTNVPLGWLGGEPLDTRKGGIRFGFRLGSANLYKNWNWGSDFQNLAQAFPFEEEIIGSDYYYKYTIQQDDIDLSENDYIEFFEVLASERSYMTMDVFWTLLDVETSRGQLQTGNLDSPRAMKSPPLMYASWDGDVYPP